LWRVVSPRRRHQVACPGLPYHVVSTMSFRPCRLRQADFRVGFTVRAMEGPCA